MGNAKLTKPSTNYKIGDIRFTEENSLGRKWALCNGDPIGEEFAHVDFDISDAGCWNHDFLPGFLNQGLWAEDSRTVYDSKREVYYNIITYVGAISPTYAWTTIRKIDKFGKITEVFSGCISSIPDTLLYYEPVYLSDLNAIVIAVSGVSDNTAFPYGSGAKSNYVIFYLDTLTFSDLKDFPKLPLHAFGYSGSQDQNILVGCGRYLVYTASYYDDGTIPGLATIDPVSGDIINFSPAGHDGAGSNLRIRILGAAEVEDYSFLVVKHHYAWGGANVPFLTHSMLYVVVIKKSDGSIYKTISLVNLELEDNFETDYSNTHTLSFGDVVISMIDFSTLFVNFSYKSLETNENVYYDYYGSSLSYGSILAGINLETFEVSNMVPSNQIKRVAILKDSLGAYVYSFDGGILPQSELDFFTAFEHASGYSAYAVDWSITNYGISSVNSAKCFIISNYYLATRRLPVIDKTGFNAFIKVNE